MALKFYNGECKVKVSKIIRQTDKSLTIALRLPGKKEMDGTWKNTNAYARFVGDAYKKGKDIREGTEFTSSSFTVDAVMIKDKPALDVCFFDIDYDGTAEDYIEENGEFGLPF